MAGADRRCDVARGGRGGGRHRRLRGRPELGAQVEKTPLVEAVLALESLDDCRKRPDSAPWMTRWS